MKLVIDASVSVKWFFPDSERESDSAIALDILNFVQSEKYTLVQPVHWLIEVFAVLVRKSSQEAALHALKIIHALNFDTVDDFTVHEKAGLLSKQYTHHLFDTLYHAVAFGQNATLITCDQKYFNKACHAGNIVLLANYPEWTSSRR